MQEINERRQAAFERYQQQYEREHSGDDDEVFKPAAGEDVVDAKQPIESYYTTHKRRYEYELASSMTKETDDFMAEDEIDQQQQQPVTRK